MITLGDVLLFLVLVLLALETARWLLRARRARSNTFSDSAWSLGAAAVASFAIAASQPQRPAPTPPQPPPDERRRTTPPFGSPIAHAPDAGVGDGGPASMLAAPEPDTRMAGETMAVDYEASPEFIMGEPVGSVQHGR